MRKTIMTLTLVAAVTLFAGQAFAWGPGTCWNTNTQNSEAQQQFYNDTQDLRGELNDLHAKLQTQYQADNPDPKEIASLTEQFVAKRNELRAKAQEAGLADGNANIGCPWGGPGNGSGAGYGPGAGNGRHMRGGYGYGPGHGYGHGHGYGMF